MNGAASQMARTINPRAASTTKPMAMSRNVMRLSSPVAKPRQERAFFKLLVVPATRSHLGELAEKLVAFLAPDSFRAGVDEEVPSFAVAANQEHALDDRNQVNSISQSKAETTAVTSTRSEETVIPLFMGGNSNSLNKCAKDNCSSPERS
jgi:hypothetical protein